jgi:hypothetical protein
VGAATKPAAGCGAKGAPHPASFLADLAARLAGAPAIEPAPLADLFNLAMAAGDLHGPVLNVLQAELLRRTLAHARASTRFYAAHPSFAGWTPPEPGLPPRLDDLPIISRQTVADRFPDFLARDVQLRSVCHTSGTTGRPLEIYKSFQEVQFIGAFFSRLFDPLLRQLPRRPLTLSFPTPHHGVPLPVPGPGIAFVSGVTDDTLIQDALRVLRTEYDVPGHDRRISVLGGMGFQILFFTSWLLEQGVDPRGFGIAAVNVAGGFMPAHWRRFLEGAWGARVQDRFSLTESAAGASLCARCGCFHPDPHLIAEAVDHDSGQPLQAGIGRLVLTNLHPFVQMQPLLRYDTGDLVELRGCPLSARPVFRFLGRARNAASRVEGGRRRWLVFSAELHEVLATLPDLNLYEWFSNVRVARDRTVGSLPVMSLAAEPAEDGRLRLRLSAELRYAPHCHPARLDELRRQILAHLAVVPGTTLAEDLSSGAVAFETRFLPPGGLRDPYVIKV